MSKSVEEVKAEIREDIDKLVDLYADLEANGWKIAEIIRFTFQAGISLIETVDDMQDIPGEQKKEVVVSSVKDIYSEISPDIPIIPEPFESWLEGFLLDKILPTFIDFQVRRAKEGESG